MAKRERELAVKERRDRKRSRKAERAAAKAEGVDAPYRAPVDQSTPD